MEETSRNRNRGEFYTPEHVSRLLYKLAQKYLGDNFNNDYNIWDNCWGTGNLTKYFDFEKLFISTLQKFDLRKHKANNKNAIEKFQYDFVNSDVDQLISPQAMWMGETELPETLDTILRDKDGGKLLFYINPPYVATGIYGTNNTDTREGQTDSKMKRIMQEHKMQSACDQAYAQFLYKIALMKKAYENKDISIAIICPPLFLTAQTYANFREVFLNEFEYQGGAIFRAGEFEGLSNNWAISIQIWKPGETKDKNNFKFDVYEMNEDTNEFEKTGEKTMYNLDGQRICMDWAKDELDSHRNIPALYTLSSGTKVSNKKQVFWQEGSLGYFFYKGNNIYHNEQECGILSLPYGDGSGYSILKENFDKTMSIFLARRAFSRYGANWKNDKDEYCIPDVNSEAYKVLTANSMVYGLFNGSTSVSSMYIPNEDGSIYEVPNNFHHISAERTKELFNKAGVEIKGPGKFEDRYMVEKFNNAINSGLITPEGMAVWQRYEQLFIETLPLRAEFNVRYPEYQVENWDAGFYQLKWLIKDYDIEKFKEFQLMYRQYEESIRHLVHECGFLK